MDTENDVDVEDKATMEDNINEDSENQENGQTIALYYWGLANLGIQSNDKVFDDMNLIITNNYDAFSL